MQEDDHLAIARLEQSMLDVVVEDVHAVVSDGGVAEAVGVGFEGSWDSFLAEVGRHMGQQVWGWSHPDFEFNFRFLISFVTVNRATWTCLEPDLAACKLTNTSYCSGLPAASAGPF